MIPIHLEWRRPVDGVELLEDALAATLEKPDGKVFASRSDRFEPVAFRVHNLEDPLSIRLVNCNSASDIIDFISRFGFPDHIGGRGHSYYPELIEWHRENLTDLFSLTSVDSSERRSEVANELLHETGTTLRPAFEWSEATGRSSLIVRASSLVSLMAMEAAFAVEAGATMTRCAHCHKAYLTGPLTGRRSHSVYCSDRCRVAAMRVRNAGKGF
ncbi:hypothetical protein ACFPLB_00195 [Aquamicrobium segne]|uniref:Zinc finger CGNR domain-containing protein n=1 Tax=Aquamicrobium segne TaxID=469547 RepID=A0ABW0GT46_9HYPH